MQMLVTRAEKVAFEDEKTQRKISGVTIECVSLESKETADRKGSNFIKTFIPDDMTPFGWFSQVPAVYDMKYETRPGRAGKALAVLVGADLIGTVALKK